ncbi:MAG: YibE/F family protein [Chloroflexi bacterium]|nr:YibE/F family protein [Chloroflexota bacterium]
MENKMNSDLLKWLIGMLLAALIIVLAFLIAPSLINLFDPKDNQTSVGYTSDTTRARIIDVTEEGPAIVLGNEQTYQILEIEVLEGEFQQMRLMIEIGKNQIFPKAYLFKPGDLMLVNVGTNVMTGETRAFFVDYVRERPIIFIFIVFCLTAIVVGGKTGLRSLLGAIIGLGVIIFFIIPQIINGANPLLTSIIGSAIFLGLSLYIVYGWRKMTHAAVAGLIVSLVLTGLFSIFAVNQTRLTGFGDENMMFLIQQSESMFDIRGVLLAGIIIGSLGVLDDLVIGQSSAVFQLNKANPAMTFKELFKSAMEIGRDHVAASVNTLILAYAGGSLPMLLLFTVTNVNLRIALNVSYISEEIIRALAGTTGLFLSVPVATLIACFLAIGQKDHSDDEINIHGHIH